jgi:hypothetical protein
MADWFARLTGDSWVLEQLSQLLRASDLSMVKHDDAYYLRAMAFDDLAEAGDVHGLAKELLPLINGALKLHFGDVTPIDMDAVARVDDHGQLHVTMMFSATMRAGARMNATAQVLGADGVLLPPPPSNIEHWTILAQRYPAAAHALRLFSYPLNWSNLHRLLEVVEEDVGGERALEAKGWVNKPDIKRFTATANSLDCTPFTGPELTHTPAWPEAVRTPLAGSSPARSATASCYTRPR